MAKRLLDILASHGIKLLIGAKLLLLIGLLSQSQRLFYIGDKAANAAEDDVAASATPPGEVKEAAEDTADAEPMPMATKRKSFLDDLLELPRIETDGLKKEELGRYMAIIERKKRQVEDRIRLLSQREKQIQNLEAAVDDKLKKLEEEMAFFRQTQQQEKDLKGKRLDELVEFYQKMPAKKAAPVFESLDKDLVVALFQRIPKKLTMEILSLMDPQKSVQISEYFGRIQSTGEYDLLKEINTSLRQEFADCKGMPRPQTH